VAPVWGMKASQGWLNGLVDVDFLTNMGKRAGLIELALGDQNAGEGAVIIVYCGTWRVKQQQQHIP